MTDPPFDNLNQPWGRISGLLLGSTAFVICVIRGVGPVEIAVRTLVVAGVTGLFVRLVVTVLQQFPAGESE